MQIATSLIIRLLLVSAIFGIPAPVAAEVPVIIANGYPIVPVEIAGQEHLFVIDTGAEGSAVYPAFAEKLALPEARAETLVGQTGEAELRTRVIVSISLDGRRTGPISATELPARSDGLPLLGIVGLDVMGGCLLDLDVPRTRAALLDGDASAMTVRGLGTPVQAVRVAGGLLAVPVTLNGVTGWAVIDTGARETRINTAFARAARLAAEDRPATSISGATQRSMMVTTARVRDARFLGQRRRSTSVRVVDLPVFATFGLGDRPAMLLGIDWLAEHRLVIDFRTAAVWLH